MELKNAVAVCLIALFSATLVVLIARSLDSQAAARLEPQLARIVEALEGIRLSGGVATASTAAANTQPLEDGLVVYYLHGNTRCLTCQAIEAQTRATVQTDFALQLQSGAMAWKVLNYEEPSVAELAKQFEVQMPVVVLARMKNGQIAAWNRLDQVWGLVNEKPAFAKFIRTEIDQMLSAPERTSTVAEPDDAAAIPLPGGAADDLPLATDPAALPIPE